MNYETRGRRDLSPLFRPASVAVIGATGDASHIRGRITAQLLGCGYPGRVREIDLNPVIVGRGGRGSCGGRRSHGSRDASALT
jgi:hypothetical protein